MLADFFDHNTLLFCGPFVGALLIGGAGMVWISRKDRGPRLQYFVFRSIENLGPHFAGGDNAWHGALVCDEPVDAITGEILRAAVERYRARYAPPSDGQRFILHEGELCQI